MNENNCVFLIKGYKIRSIAAKDDAAIAKIIRTNLQHFHLDIPEPRILIRSLIT